TVSLVATTPKPRLVKFAILPQGEEPFTIGNFRHSAMHYVVKVEIGGVTGFLARLMGKQPADTHIWVLGGEAPAFVKAEGDILCGRPYLANTTGKGRTILESRQRLHCSALHCFVGHIGLDAIGRC